MPSQNENNIGFWKDILWLVLIVVMNLFIMLSFRCIKNDLKAKEQLLESIQEQVTINK